MIENAITDEPVDEHRGPGKVVWCDDLSAAAHGLTGHLLRLGPDVAVARRGLGRRQTDRAGSTL